MTSQRTRDRLVTRLIDAGINDMRVLDVMRQVPRHLFVDEALSHRAYEDTALPIGYNQTISQPYTVAKMTEILLAGGELKRVLEIGTGSGYQTSVLCCLVKQVYSVERIHPLQERAKQRLSELRLRNVHYKHADGGFGWSDKGPFDGILCAAAPEEVPHELLEQLAIGGRLVLPVGGSKQELRLIVRNTEHDYKHHVIEEAKFVPMLSGSVR